MSFWTPAEVEDQFDVHQRQVRARRAAARVANSVSMLAELGIQAHPAPIIGDVRGQLRREIAVEDLLASQLYQNVVAVDCAVTLHDGRRLETGEEITPEMLGDADVEEADRRTAFAELRARRMLSTIDPQVAFERSLPPDHEFIVYEPFEHASRRYERGQAVSPSDFPEPPRKAPTELELGLQAIRRDLGLRAAPPAVSLWRTLLSDGTIVRNPNFKPGKGK